MKSVLRRVPGFRGYALDSVFLSFLVAAIMSSTQTLKIEGPSSYVCYRATEPLSLLGNIADPAWQSAPWTADFVDIQGSRLPKPRFRTRAKMLWDDTYLYIAAQMEEPQLWATLTEHDSVIFRDNDFEVFIDPDNDGRLYSELELNQLNTTWDLLLVNSYRGGGPAVNGFELKGLKTAVQLQGDLNDPTTTTEGWTTEIAIPWAAFRDISAYPCPPRDGDQWRINFSRVEWHVTVADGKYVKVPGLPEDNWVWSPMGVIDMHRPERWGVLQFSDLPKGSIKPKPLAGWAEKNVLAQIWQAESDFRRTNHRWGTLEEVGEIRPDANVKFTDNLLEIHFEGYAVDQSLHFWKL
jgi:hypothetical protein